MTQTFQNKRIVVGVSGGIAAYKAVLLVRELVTLGAQVRVVMTQSALQFVGPLTFQALSGFPVISSVFEHQVDHGMDHISLARWAEWVIVAPITANSMAKLAAGFADDALSTLMLATKAAILLCPGMNQQMWMHPATQANYHLLSSRGLRFIGPEDGFQACGEYGVGRMSEVQSILNALYFFSMPRILEGQSVVVTAGPTREPIDPVRFLSNRSSGKMGYALAAAAYWAGASVTLISGPSALSVPEGVERWSVETAQQMYDGVMHSLRQAPKSSIFIAAAAVSDFSCESVFNHKMKKESIGDQLHLALKKTQDILFDVAQWGLAQYIVGFAAETEQLLFYARDKLMRKHLDMVIANEVGDQLGFDQDEHSLWVLTADSKRFLSHQRKEYLAIELVNEIATRSQERDREAIYSN